jgi:uncharacterized protein YjeT (DUF2065 family)
MNFDFSLFLCVVGMACALEGIAWAAFPHAMRRAMHELLQQSDNVLRGFGIAALAVGLLLTAFGRL